MLNREDNALLCRVVAIGGREPRVVREMLGQRAVRVGGAESEGHLPAHEPKLIEVIARVDALPAWCPFRNDDCVAFHKGVDPEPCQRLSTAIQEDMF